MLFSQENRIYNYDLILKKGKNRIVLKTKNTLDLIEIKKDNKITLILK